MNEDFRLPGFDPDYCLKVARWSSVVCVGWLLIELILLAVLDLQGGTCSNWIIQTNIWLLILLFTVAPTAWLGFNVVRWRHFSQKTYNRILKYPEYSINHDNLLLGVCISWALFCSFPLWITLAGCTTLFRPSERLRIVLALVASGPERTIDQAKENVCFCPSR